MAMKQWYWLKIIAIIGESQQERFYTEGHDEYLSVKYEFMKE